MAIEILRPNAYSANAVLPGDGTGSVTNPTNAYDTDKGTAAVVSAVQTNSGAAAFYEDFLLTFPNKTKTWKSWQMKCLASWSSNSVGTGNSMALMYYSTDNGGSYTLSDTPYLTAPGGGYSLGTWNLTPVMLGDPTATQLRALFRAYASMVSGLSNTITMNINDIWIEGNEQGPAAFLQLF